MGLSLKKKNRIVSNYIRNLYNGAYPYDLCDICQRTEDCTHFLFEADCSFDIDAERLFVISTPGDTEEEA